MLFYCILDRLYLKFEGFFPKLLLNLYKLNTINSISLYLVYFIPNRIFLFYFLILICQFINRSILIKFLEIILNRNFQNALYFFQKLTCLYNILQIINTSEHINILFKCKLKNIIVNILCIIYNIS